MTDHCRDCADNFGTCPYDGKPCDPGTPKRWSEFKKPQAQQDAPTDAEPVRWGSPDNVRELIRQLETLPQDAPIHAAFHVRETGKPTVAMVRGVMLSRERVNGRRIETGNESVPYGHVIWAQPHDAPAQDAERERDGQIPAGWVFSSADFSIQAADPTQPGRVMLVRDMPGRKWWHSLPEEDLETVNLHVFGTGMTMQEATANAADAARAQRAGKEAS